MGPRLFRHCINLYPPYLMTGIHVSRVSADFREIDIELALRFYNRNYVGTQFGGSLYAMVDPFYMLMLMRNLGSDYVVWDRSASIDFIRPGRGRVRAELRIDDTTLEQIRQATRHGDKHFPQFEVEILDTAGQVVARVKKTLYVRKKRHVQA